MRNSFKLVLALLSWLWLTPALAQYVTPVQMRDANLSTSNTQNYITTAQSFTAPRTLTIPDRSSLSAYYIQFIDTAGAVSLTNTLTVQISGGGLINGQSTLVINSPNDYIFFAPSSTGYSATLIPQSPISNVAGGTNGQVQYNNAGALSGFTVSGDASLNTSTGVFTFGTVNANTGTWGSATQCAAITVNGKGLVTAASQNLCAPAIASVTGLGSGVATALGNATNASGGFVTFGGSAGTLTANITGTAGGAPLSGITGLGTGVSAILGATVNGAGGLVGFTNAFTNIAPTATRAGDIIYWNGSAYVTLAGNNSGTQLLQETSSGVPSWVTVSGTGTVTSVTCFGTAITSSGTCTTAGQIPGVASNTSAAAGNIGEFVIANLPVASSVTLTSSSPVNIISISLTAGDWDVQGIGWVGTGGSTAVTASQVGISTTSATLPSLDSGALGSTGSLSASSNISKDTPVFRVIIGSTTTVYLVEQATFTSTAPVAWGQIRARRNH